MGDRHRLPPPGGALEPWFERWLRQAMLSYDHNDILGFFGHAPTMFRKGRHRIETSVLANFEGRRIKHGMDSNSLKLYHEANVLRTETTLIDAGAIHVRRPPADDPAGTVKRRPLQRSVVDLPRRAAYCQTFNERYVEAWRRRRRREWCVSCRNANSDQLVANAA